MKTTILSTRRLALKEITEEDTEFVVMLRSEPEVYRYFFSSHKITSAEHIEWFRKQYLHDGSRFDYVARVKDGSYAIGVFGIKKTGKNAVEISYILDPAYRGRGYAFEAVSALLEFAKKEWECETAVAKIHKENKASMHFAESSGFSPVLQEDSFITYKRQL